MSIYVYKQNPNVQTQMYLFRTVTKELQYVKADRLEEARLVYLTAS